MFEVFKKETETKIKELEDGLNFANKERESFKKKFQEIQNQVHLLKDEKLYMEVYQRRENLPFLEIKEEKDVKEDTREVLIDFLKTGLSMEDVDNLEFHRVHRITVVSPTVCSPTSRVDSPTSNMFKHMG